MSQQDREDNNKPIEQDPEKRKQELRDKYRKFLDNDALYANAYQEDSPETSIEKKEEGGEDKPANPYPNRDRDESKDLSEDNLIYTSDDDSPLEQENAAKKKEIQSQIQHNIDRSLQQDRLAYNEKEDVQMSFVEHLDELRTRFIRILIVMGVFLVASIAFSEFLVQFLQQPYTQYGHKLITIRPTGAFLARLKIALMSSFVVAMPFIIHQIWLFIFPALSGRFKKLGIPLMLFAYILFLGGVAFNFFIVLPFVLEALIKMVWEGVQVLYNVNDYYDFLLIMSLLFGSIFEMPIVVLIFVRLGLFTHRFLIQQWRYSLVGGTVLAALLTPPDAISQVMMLVPMILLYFLSIAVAFVFRRRDNLS